MKENRIYMRKITAFLSAALLVSIQHSAVAQTKLIEKVAAKGNAVVIPYEKYVLPNGLTVIIHEDHSDPIVHVDVTYHVGSAREEIGKSGFAHFFEHMMFQGSEHVADEQHFKIITEAGGTLNGTTNRDRTNYFETVPSNQLEKMLWLEADRMGYLLDSVTQRKFEVQRATVKNERGQRYDNVPYGLVSEVTAKNLYPYGHPYSWLTIGYVEDLNRVNVQDLKNFFMRWYSPNNAVLTIGGDVTTKDVLKLVEKYFGPIPKGPAVQAVKVPAPVLTADRYVSMMDNYAKLPQLRIVYPTVPEFSKDEPALDCLSEILGKGKSSMMYKNLIKTQKAVNANVYNSTSELSGEFVFSVTPYGKQDLKDIEKLIRETMEEFEKRGVTYEDMEKFKTEHESQLIYGLESVNGKVSQLAAFQTYTGNANYIGTEISRYNAVTKEDVMSVYNKYIKGKHAVIVSVLTKGQEQNKAAQDNYNISKDGYKAPNYGYAGLKYNKGKDLFDRKTIPSSGPAPIIRVPSFWKKTLPGNVVVMGAQTQEIPVVNMMFHFKGGKMMEAGDLNKAGMVFLFASMMEEDTKNHTAAEFSSALERLGSSINVSSARDGIDVTVRSLSKNLDKTMELVAERILSPKFTEEALTVAKKRNIENIKNSQNQPTYIAGNVYNKINYGTNSVLGKIATEETINNISILDMENYYKNYFSKDDAEVIIVGDISENDAAQKVAFLQQMSDTKVYIPSLPIVPTIEKTKIYFVNVPNAAQTEFRIGYVTDMKYDATGEYYTSTIMNYPFGGAFNSRLNLDLREDRGWTYGARSYFSGDRYTGSFTFSAGIKAAATDSALRDIINILTEYRKNGISSEELSFTQKSMGLSEARKYETGFQKAGFLSQILEYNLPEDFSKKQNELLNKITKEELLLLAKKRLPDADKMNIVLVGDKAKVWNNLQKFGYEVVELDKDGNPVKQ